MIIDVKTVFDIFFDIEYNFKYIFQYPLFIMHFYDPNELRRNAYMPFPHCHMYKRCVLNMYVYEKKKTVFLTVYIFKPL